MMIRFLLAVAVILIMSLPYTISPQTLNDSVRDKHFISMSTIIDSKLLEYYVNHSGELPESLDTDALESLGLRQADLEDDRGNLILTYVKVSGNSFLLSFTDSQNIIRMSPHSGTALQTIEKETY